MSRIGASVALGAGLALASVACGLGLEGLGGDGGNDAGTGADAVVVDATLDLGSDAPVLEDAPGEARSDAGKDGSAVDARADTGAADADDGSVADSSSDACEGGTVEICDDGIDNNCNGLIDCADPQCVDAGYECTPQVPPSWELVGYTQSTRPTCPTGWGNAVALVEGVDGGGSCQCTCGAPVANPCIEGTASMSLGQNACACGTVQNVPLVSDGGCDPIGAPIGPPCSSWGDGNVKPIGPKMVACAQSTVPTQIAYASQGQTCAPPAMAGGGCASGGGCYPGAAPAAACIEAAGIQPGCPQGFPHLHYVVEPSNVVDTRQCGSCGCSSTPASCNGAIVTLFDDPTCSINAVPITANGNCNSFVGDPSDAGWFIYAATPSTTQCSGTSTTPIVDAGLLLRAPATICCP